MVPMTIKVTRVNAGGMPPTGAGPAGLVAATVQVHVPAINCRAGTTHELSGTGRIDSGGLERNPP